MCSPGSIAPIAGSLACNRCRDGFTTPNATRTACSVCLPGRAGPDCQRCRPGTWSPGGSAAGTVCTACPPGTHSTMTGSTTEKDCKPKKNICLNPNPCKDTANSNGVCTAVNKTAYTCGCRTGYTWENGMCADENGCKYEWGDNRCLGISNNNGTCFDKAAPLTGFACGCSTGATWDATKLECKDDDGCSGDPCAPSKVPQSSGKCLDIPAPSTGFACACKAGFWWDGIACSAVADTCVQVVAGITGAPGYSGDGGPATGAAFYAPRGLSVDAEGNLYIADSLNLAIRKVSTAGIVTTVVKPDQMARNPGQVLATPSGDVYFTENSAKLYKLEASTGGVTSSVEVGPGSNIFYGLTYNSGNITVAAYNLFADVGRIYSFTPDLSVFAEVEQNVPVGSPQSIVINSTGDVFITTGGFTGSNILNKAPAGEQPAWNTWNSGANKAQDGVLATSAKLSVSGLALDAAGNMLVTDSELCMDCATYTPSACHVWLVDAATGKLKLVAGTLGKCGSKVDVNSPTKTLIGPAWAVAFDPSGKAVYLSDPDNHRVLKVKLDCGRK
ncbi:hypothetical protein OEZ85_014429 [Tetradesmus obliquus]|uniref:EGF-like domain-containing protein n=1 Tax=Tetradesmus obliquus TaxID=3088 RepID=A0ABY8U831_TETOB|nr:hypothetical protein OEZ85_014429 [Tetradesmus obliquus]